MTSAIATVSSPKVYDNGLNNQKRLTPARAVGRGAIPAPTSTYCGNAGSSPASNSRLSNARVIGRGSLPKIVRNEVQDNDNNNNSQVSLAARVLDTAVRGTILVSCAVTTGVALAATVHMNQTALISTTLCTLFVGAIAAERTSVEGVVRATTIALYVATGFASQSWGVPNMCASLVTGRFVGNLAARIWSKE